MSKNILGILLLLLSINIYAEDNIEGLWIMGEKHTLIEIYEDSGKLFGIIVSSDNKDIIEGKEFLSNFEWQDKAWFTQITVGKKAKQYKAKMIPNEENLQIIVSSGFVQKSIILSNYTGLINPKTE